MLFVDGFLYASIENLHQTIKIKKQSKVRDNEKTLTKKIEYAVLA